MAPTTKKAKKTLESNSAMEVSEDEKFGKPPSIDVPLDLATESTPPPSPPPPDRAKPSQMATAMRPSAASAKAKAAQALSTLPIFSKPPLGSIPSPRKKRPDPTCGRACVTIRTRDGTSLCWFEKDPKTPVYMYHMVKSIESDPDLARKNLRIDLTKL